MANENKLAQETGSERKRADEDWHSFIEYLLILARHIKLVQRDRTTNRDVFRLLPASDITRVGKLVLIIHVNGISGSVKNRLTQPNTICSSREAIVISAIERLLVVMNGTFNAQFEFIVDTGTG
ncbi:hypothetical protein T11_15588 [Trichinella zimbabwensis]|uniref:Uncharacterized protein n=1 Tax=Trichinella zimbabwensis TaxID=268475 RepID=A0A0V1H747_9BILA|nr:hypothetical protein T11_15588 [Trichinella zimbabwensis]